LIIHNLAHEEIEQATHVGRLEIRRHDAMDTHAICVPILRDDVLGGGRERRDHLE
jgi:hypothetical protein